MSEKKFNEDYPYNQPLIETDNFAVIPTVGAIVEGWLLIIPKKHYVSFGYIKDLELYKELDILLSEIALMVRDTYGDFVVFENGALCPNSTIGCGVDYAHLHIVPTKNSLIKEIQGQFGLYYDWKIANGLKDSIDYIDNNLPYLYYRTQEEISYITTDANIPSQLFRKSLAMSMGLSDKYDWKKEPFFENIEKTISKYSAYLGVVI